jgi:hypothetical protein
VRHNAISEQGVDFEEHCVGDLWVVWSHGPWKKTHVGAYETQLCHSVWILCPQTKLSTCP